MAAILTDRATQGDVKTIIGALREKYRFCADRNTVQLMMTSYPSLLPETVFVKDPIDGMAGFVNKRGLTLDNLDVTMANVNPSYCHAAMMVKQTLEYEHANSRHCDKTTVGKPLATQAFGIPVSERYGPKLKALFSKTINLNVLTKAYRHSPEAQCSAVESQIRGEEKSLSMEQLAGVWFVTFGFASLGLVVHYFKPWEKIKVLTRKERQKKKADKKRVEREERNKRKAEVEKQRMTSGASVTASSSKITWKMDCDEGSEETEIMIPDHVLELSQFSHLFLDLKEEEESSCPIQSTMRKTWGGNTRSVNGNTFT